jgi:argininosuccinate lyase
MNTKRKTVTKKTKTAITPLWSGRLSDKPSAEAFAFQASIGVDMRLVFDDIAGSRAHVSMLGKQKIIPASTAAQIDKELVRIAQEIKSGKLIIDRSAEDIHSFIEGILTKRLGDAGRMVHAGRSRNDQVATDFRLYLKHAIAELRQELAATFNVLLDKAEQHAACIMPGYTHLQRAQPVTLGYHIVAWCAGLARDYSRLSDASDRLDECPLGSGALAGSSLPLDRKATAQVLGFSRPSLNSMDSVADRDFALELSAACAITMIHLSRFCEDIIIWASEEFGFIKIAESYSTGSSIMPQKKNPDFAELIRGKAGRTTGNLVTLLTLLKGLPYAYNKDLQEDKESLFDSIDTLKTCLRMFAGILLSAEFNLKKMKAACSGGFIEATDAADYLVRKGLPFRKAHETIALVVRDCIDAGRKHIGELSLAELKKHSKLFREDIFALLKPAACVKARSLPGGPSLKEVRRQIKILRKVVVRE